MTPTTAQGGDDDPVASLAGALSNDQLVGGVAKLWQANPFHDVVPVDWAKVATALQTVWMRAMSDPARMARTSAELAQRMSQATLEVWRAALARWLGQPAPEQKAVVHPGKGDKRFTAPEWEANPYYQTLQQLYLLASDYLVEQAAASAPWPRCLIRVVAPGLRWPRSLDRIALALRRTHEQGAGRPGRRHLAGGRSAPGRPGP
jgi:hypothetical protein